MSSSQPSTELTRETRDAYARWAPAYPPVAHNPLMRAEQQAVLDLWPRTTGARALDLACGSGRYSRVLQETGSAEVVALDFCLPMLQQVGAASRVCASMMDLPFLARSFDFVVSGLAVGHASGIEAWMSEVSRVLRDGGTLLYSDFHPQAARAGLTRSFKDADGNICNVPHELFDVDAQLDAAAAAGLTVEATREVRLGREIRESFPGSDSIYRDWDGLPVVLVVRAHK